MEGRSRVSMSPVWDRGRDAGKGSAYEPAGAVDAEVSSRCAVEPLRLGEAEEAVA